MKTIVLSALILIFIDSIYLYFIKNLFAKHISTIQHSPLQINIQGALLCYMFLVGGLNYFILHVHNKVMDAFILGLVIYGVFESTNLALFKRWPPTMVILDTLWGGILFASTTYILNII